MKGSAMHLPGTVCGNDGLQPVLLPLVIRTVAAVFVQIAVGGSRRGG